MSENYKTSGKQIAKNSLYLYFRQILTLLVSLITVRYTMSALGVIDYGVNSVVAGTVSMFQFLVGSLAMGTQRFFSFHIGRNDKEMLAKTFKQTFTIYLLLGLFVVLLTEIVGIWFVENKLVIPADRMFASRFIFQVSVLSMFLTTLQSPFMASVVAHENMKIFAQVSVYDVIMRLVVVILLVLSPFDKLISLSILTFIVGLSTLVFYQWYTRSRYEECRSVIYWEKSLAKEILSFNVWNLFGNFAWMMKNQGMAMILNMFFGPIVNASQQIGTQIRTICVGFSHNITAAVKPQIIKSYAVQDYDRMFNLVQRTAKLTFFVMLIMTVPILFHLEFVLNLWLVEVPEYAVVICHLLLIENLVEVCSLPYATVNQATGKIALYQFLVGFVGILCVPISYVGFKMGGQPELGFKVAIFTQALVSLIRLIFVQRVQGANFRQIIRKVFLPCFVTAAFAYLISYYTNIYTESIWKNVIGIIYKVIITSALAFFIGLEREEKNYIVNIVKTKMQKR